MAVKNDEEARGMAINEDCCPIGHRRQSEDKGRGRKKSDRCGEKESRKCKETVEKTGVMEGGWAGKRVLGSHRRESPSQDLQD